MAKCKRCGLKTVLSEDDIQKMVEQVTSMKSVRLVSSDVYKNRFVKTAMILCTAQRAVYVAVLCR